MENQSTPKPDSEEYNVDRPQDLNTPKFNSNTEKRTGEGLPAIENMNDQDERVEPEDSNRLNMPETDLGNNRDDDEEEKEDLIRK